MAGDWIKLEHATLDKPEVLRTADLLGIHRREALGLFAEFWIWLDKNLSGSCPDFVRNMSRKSLDEVLHTPGFASVLEAIGWAEFDDSKAVMRITNAERHNGTPAKTRALDAKRKKEKRLGNVREMSGSQPDKTGTREEKRREDKKPIAVEVPEWVPVEAWDAFVEMRAKIKAPLTDRGKTLALAELAKLRAQGHDPRALIDTTVLNNWKSFYAPKAGSVQDDPWKGAK